MKVISYNSRILNPQEQKLSTLDRELLGIVHALQIYEFLIIGSPHPIHIFTDHKPLLHCFTKKGNLSPRFYRAQKQLTKFSKLKIIHTPGKNLSVADMLSRSFTKAELQLNQLKHKQLPPQIDFALLQDNTLKPVHYLIKHEEILPHQKHDSHPILADYGTDQFSIRINDKGNDIVVKPLQSFSFKSVTPFQTKFKTPTKKNNKTLHQQSLLLNDTDVTSDDEDHIYTRIPKSDSSFLQDTTLQTENFSTLNQLTHITSQKYVSAINVQPNLPSLTHCQQIIPFYDTSFFKYENYFQGFFLPDDYSLDIKTLQQQQSRDPVLRTVYSSLLNNEKPEFITPLITGTQFLHVYYKRFSQLFIDESTNLISLYITNPTVTNQSSTPNFVQDTIRICLPFRMFKTVFNKLHEHSHTGMKITYNTFKQYYYIPFLEKWLSIFIHDCIECQRNKHFNMKIQTAPTQSFSEHAPSFNYRLSMDTKGPINPPSHNKSYIHVIIDAFSHFVVTVPIKSNNAKTAIKTLLHHWIIKFGPPIYLVTDRGSEYVNKEMAHLCTLMGIRHSPRTAYSPWTNGLVEVQNRNLGTHLRMFLHDTPKDWAFQVHMYAYAHNSQPLSELNVSPHEIVFHTRPRIPLTFDLNLNRDTSKTCISRYCSQLPEHSHYDKSLLSRSFTKAELQLNQLKHKQLPPQIDFALLQDNTLKPVHYLLKHEEILPHQKHDSHPILADYGTDQFSIRINDKGNDIVVKPLQSFSFKSVTPFQTKFKTPTKKNNKTLHQEFLLLNDTDVTSDDEDHIYTRIPKSDSSFLKDTTLQTENFSTLNQLNHITSQKSVSAINVQPNLPSLTHCQQIIPFYDTSFFKYENYFQGFFLPDDYSLDIKTLQQQQSQDPVLRTVYSSLLNNEKPEFITPLITGTPFLHVYYKRFSQLFIDESTNLISLYITNPTVTNQSSTPNFVQDTIRICLPFRMFKTVFNKLHEHSHTGMKITYNTFKQYYYIPFLEKWLSIFIHDCIECQRNKHFNMKIQTAPTQSFSEHAPSFNYRISMDTKGPINPPSHNKSYIHVIIDAFSHFVVTVPIKSNNAKTAIKTLLHHWIIKFGPPIYLVTDRGSEYVNKEMAHLCTLMGIRHSPRTAYSPWTNGLVEVQNRNLGTHLRMFLHDTPKDWAFQVHMYAYAHNSQPLSELNVSPHEIVFHTRPRIPLTFDLNLNRDTSKTCISRYCSQLPEHSHYDKSDLNPFFYKTLSKPILQWFLAVETAMLQIYSTVYENTLQKIIHTHTLQKLTTKVNPFLLVPLF